MGFYEQNIENIKKYKTQVYEGFLKYKKENKTKELEEVYSVDSRDNIKSLIIKKDNKEYRMNSIFHPLREAEQWVKQYSFYHLENVVVMFGLGNAVFAECLINNMNENDRIIIYEPSVEVFFHILNQYNLQSLIMNNKVVLLINNINGDDLHRFLEEYINIRNMKTRIVCIHPGYDKIFPEKAIYFWGELKNNYFHTRININAEIYFGKIYIDNAFKNYKFLNNCVGLMELGEILPKNMPVILIAAGPSVEDNIDELRKAKGKAILIAVDRVLDYLLDHNVEPDIIATLDPVKPVKLFSRRENLTIPLMCIIESSTQVLEKHKGRKIICDSTEFTNRMYGHVGSRILSFSTGTSVATITFGAIVAMGFKTIILVGQDLAYRGKYTHAGQVVDDEECMDRLVDGIDGNKVESRIDWYEFTIWFQDMIKFNPSIKVYDTKSSGAKIEGTIVKSLDQIMSGFTEKKNDISKLINSMESRFNTEQLRKMWDFLNKCKEDIIKVKDKSKEGYEISKSLINEYEKNGATSKVSKIYLKDINKLLDFIQNCGIYDLLDKYVTAVATDELIKVNTFTENESENKLQTYTITKIMFQYIQEACDFTLPRLEKLNNKEFMYGEKGSKEKI